MMKKTAWQPMPVLTVRTLNQEQLDSLGDLTPIEYLGPAGLFKQDVAFRDRTGPRKRNLLRASRLGRIDKVRPIRQNMPIW